MNKKTSLKISGFRARTPGASKDEDRGIIPVLETKPLLGLNENTPFLKPGIIRLPLVSVPSAASQKPAATAMADPELEPPQGKFP